MVWPPFEEALAWLAQACAEQGLGGKTVAEADLRVLLAAAGGRPRDVLDTLAQREAREAAAQWRALPQAVAQGQAAALADFGQAGAIAALQKLCHDVWALKLGAEPRFFPAEALPAVAADRERRGPTLYGLGQWAKELAAGARSAEHPYNAGLMLEALVSRAQQALRG